MSLHPSISMILEPTSKLKYTYDCWHWIQYLMKKGTLLPNHPEERKNRTLKCKSDGYSNPLPIWMKFMVPSSHMISFYFFLSCLLDLCWLALQQPRVGVLIAKAYRLYFVSPDVRNGYGLYSLFLGPSPTLLISLCLYKVFLISPCYACWF